VHVATIRVADGTLTPLVTTPFTNTTPALSHDGRWIAYASDESGSSEIYVHAFPSMQERRQVSAGGGAEPVWARDGRELYYRGKGKIMSVAFSTANGFVADAPQPLFDDRLGNAQGAGHTGYDATSDGKLVMVARPSMVDTPTTLLKIVFKP
jgi:eukaryotic-like serine/threonine-protein kinase